MGGADPATHLPPLGFGDPGSALARPAGTGTPSGAVAIVSASVRSTAVCVATVSSPAGDRAAGASGFPVPTHRPPRNCRRTKGSDRRRQRPNLARATASWEDGNAMQWGLKLPGGA